MSKAWVWLSSQRKVEFIIRGKSFADVTNIILQNPQIHLDSILSSMPYHAGVIIQPHFKMNQIHIVIGPGQRVENGPANQRYSTYEKPEDITYKFWHSQRRVIEDLESGKIRNYGRDCVSTPEQMAKSAERRQICDLTNLVYNPQPISGCYGLSCKDPGQRQDRRRIWSPGERAEIRNLHGRPKLAKLNPKIL